MPRLLAFVLLAFLASAVAARADGSWQGRALHGCEATEGYPPFTFPGPDKQPRGYSVDLLNAALAGTGMRLEVAFLPTKRCSAGLDDGTLDLSMEDSWNPEFAGRWLPSDVTWQGTDVLFFDRSRHPQGISAADVIAHPKDHPGCGLLGGTYGGFGPDQIDDRAYQFANAFNRLLAGDCEFFPELLEFGTVFVYRGQKLLDNPRIGYVVQRVPDPTAHDPLYIYLRRGFPDAPSFMARINDTIIRWRATGEDRATMAKYIDLSVLPKDP